MYELKRLRSRAASAENLQALRGAGGTANGGRKGAPCIAPLKDGQTHVLLDADGPGMVRHLWCTIPPGSYLHMRGLILRAYWDGQRHPSIEVPLGDFFGVAHGQQRPMVSACVAMQGAKGFNSWMPMPFQRRARITIENDSGSDVGALFYQVDFTQGDRFDKHTGYLHAQFRRSNPCPQTQDYVILDGVAGQGAYVGTVLGVRSLYTESWWGEGEVKFYIDGDDPFPTICGTGTEDYIGSAWGLEEVGTPYQGAPLVDGARALYSLYRFHVPDPIYFQSDLKVTIQQMGFGLRSQAEKHYGAAFIPHPAAGAPSDSPWCYYERSDDYSSVAYWYQSLPSLPFPALPARETRTQDLPQTQNVPPIALT